MGTTVEAATGKPVATGFAVAGHAPAVVVPAEDPREALAKYEYGHDSLWFLVWQSGRDAYGVMPVDIYPFERTARSAAHQRGERTMIDLRQGTAVPVA